MGKDVDYDLEWKKLTNKVKKWIIYLATLSMFPVLLPLFLIVEFVDEDILRSLTNFDLEWLPEWSVGIIAIILIGVFYKISWEIMTRIIKVDWDIK